MSNPTFNSVPLTTDAPQEVFGPIKVRASREHMPGLTGEYAQLYGAGGRDIMLRGLVSATGASATLAITAARTAYAVCAATARGATVASYVTVDAVTHTNCYVPHYTQAGPVQLTGSGASSKAYIPIQAVIRQLCP